MTSREVAGNGKARRRLRRRRLKNPNIPSFLAGHGRQRLLEGADPGQRREIDVGLQLPHDQDNLGGEDTPLPPALAGRRAGNRNGKKTLVRGVFLT